MLLVLALGLLAGCNPDSSEPEPAGLNTWLLVRAPDGPLPVNQPIEVRSRVEDAVHGVSHVELHLVEFQPVGGGPVADILIRADAAPFDQTSFTASQIFIPKQPGRYAIMVTGYNHNGQAKESDTISFEAR